MIMEKKLEKNRCIRDRVRNTRSKLLTGSMVIRYYIYFASGCQRVSRAKLTSALAQCKYLEAIYSRRTNAIDR